MRFLTSAVLALAVQASSAFAFAPAEIDASSTWNFFEPQYDLPNVQCSASVGDEDAMLAVSYYGEWTFELMNLSWGMDAMRDWPDVTLRAAGQEVKLGGFYMGAESTVGFTPGWNDDQTGQDLQTVFAVLDMLSAGDTVQVLVDGQNVGNFQLIGSSAALQQLAACSETLWN